MGLAPSAAWRPGKKERAGREGGWLEGRVYSLYVGDQTLNTIVLFSSFSGTPRKSQQKYPAKKFGLPRMQIAVNKFWVQESVKLERNADNSGRESWV